MIASQDGNEVGRVRADAGEREALVSGLLADTEYLVTVWAENNIGQSSNHSLLVQTLPAGMLPCEVLYGGMYWYGCMHVGDWATFV